MTRCLPLAVVLMFAAVGVHAQVRAPNEDELHITYCVPIIKGKLEAAQQAVAAQDRSLAEINAAAGSPDIVKAATEVLDNLRGEASRYRALLSRLQSYLLPRPAELDLAALLTAENRGKADWQSHVGKSDGKDKDLVVRIRACENPTWLPF